MAKLWRFPLHSLILGAYAILALIAFNLQESPLSEAVRSLAAGLLLATVLLVLLKLLHKNWARAGLIASVLLIAFFSYGHLYDALKLLGAPGLLLARHRFLLPLWLAPTALAVWRILKLKNMGGATAALNFIALFLLIFPLFQISSFLIRNWFAQQEQPASTTRALSLQASADAPDVYYIIADAYARDDVLQSFYHFDNRDFLAQLQGLGFYVAQCSLSNYPKTRLSLTSSLNMDYMEGLGITANDQADEFWRRIRNSTVRKTFEAQGYKIVSFETGFYWTEWPDADLYLSREKQGLNGVQLNSFETLLLKTTLLRAVVDLQPLLSQPLVNAVEISPLQEHYDITRYALDTLPQLAQVAGPKFVFVHLLIPHGPFVFDAEGNFTTEELSLEEAYNQQMIYLNRRLLEIFTTLINESERPVVIILQGDHGGPGTQYSHDRMKILNAYYLPEGSNQLYPSISPVNSFRLIFDTYFEYEYPLVDDLSYYSTSENFFNMTLISDDRPGCTQS